MDLFNNLKKKINKKIPVGPIATFIGFVFILCLSWFYLTPSLLNEKERVHSYLQDEFQVLVSDWVAKKHPEVNKITFHKVWTKETPQPDQIKIYFHYSLFTKGDAGGELLIKGESLLEKSPTQETLWIAKNFQVTNSLVEFSEPMLIKSDQPVKNQTE